MADQERVQETEELAEIMDIQDRNRRDLALMTQRELDRRREVQAGPAPARERQQEPDLER